MRRYLVDRKKAVAGRPIGPIEGSHVQIDISVRFTILFDGKPRKPRLGSALLEK